MFGSSDDCCVIFNDNSDGDMCPHHFDAVFAAGTSLSSVDMDDPVKVVCGGGGGGFR